MAANKNMLDFLKAGETTKDHVIIELGEPSATFDDERIFTYRIGYDNNKGYFIKERHPGGWFGTKFSLVLIFNDKGLLSKHSLVEVN